MGSEQAMVQDGQKRPSARESKDVTELLIAWKNGDQRALEELMPRVYHELQRIARAYLRRERDDHTWQTTELVHEAYARLFDMELSWQNRKHFYVVAARVMRRLLVDHARAWQAAKRAGVRVALSCDQLSGLVQPTRAPELIALDDSLARLEALDPMKGAIVQLRYFGGLSIDETADVIGCSRGTIVRHWRCAKAWLYRDLANTSTDGDAP